MWPPRRLLAVISQSTEHADMTLVCFSPYKSLLELKPLRQAYIEALSRHTVGILAPQSWTSNPLDLVNPGGSKSPTSCIRIPVNAYTDKM